MATDFIMPRPEQQAANLFTHPRQQSPTYAAAAALQQQQQQQQQQLNYFNHQSSSTQVSPLGTPYNGSPTSPSSGAPSKGYHSRQLRPLYIPAVLRPNEHPSRMPVQVVKPDVADDCADDRSTGSSRSSLLNLSGLGSLTLLNRRSTGDSGKFVEDDMNLDLFPEVTSAPTRQHWKPDPKSAICDEPTCKRYFSYFTRRHHCRRCGNIFCDDHSSYTVPLDQDAEYNPRGQPQRSCGHCYREFQSWRSRSNSEDSTASRACARGHQTAPASPTTMPAVKNDDVPAGHIDLAKSVPSDWHWSTF